MPMMTRTRVVMGLFGALLLMLAACGGAPIAENLPTEVTFPTPTTVSEVAAQPTTAATAPPEVTDLAIATAPPTQTATPSATQTATLTQTAPVTPSATITETVTPTVTNTAIPTSESSAFEALAAVAANATVLPPGFTVGGTPVNLPPDLPIEGTPSSLQPAIETFGGGAPPTVVSRSLGGGVSRPLATSAPIGLLTPTPVSQQSLGGCSAVPYPGGFQTLREQRPNIQTVIGCVLGSEQRVPSVYQPFERGFMLYLGSPLEVIVVGSQDESFRVYTNTFNPSADPASGADQPPSGLFQPANALGKVWRNDRGVRAGLGWATAPPGSGESVSARFTKGWLIYAPQRNDILLLADNLKRWWGLSGRF